ncbi:MAG TPA: PEP-CTERM sorting domain-containing protein [Dongiaceae bacterium]|jgi:hypothetical protein|nr:PEP-CTERM sorting domain-containing protein [Dongiaceae bacterium]
MKANKTLLAASSSVLAAGMAHGAVVTHFLNHTVNTGDAGYNFDLNSDSTDDYKAFFDNNNAAKPCILGASTTSGSYPGTFPNPTPFVFNELNMNAVAPASNDNNGVPVIPAGTAISSQFTVGSYTLTIGDAGGDTHGKNEGYLYQNGENNTVGQWPAGQDTFGYVGLAMVDTSLSTTNYGWLELEFNGINSTMTLIETGYETTPGTAIVTPPLTVPEPGTVALTGLGGALLVLARKKMR